VFHPVLHPILLRLPSCVPPYFFSCSTLRSTPFSSCSTLRSTLCNFMFHPIFYISHPVFHPIFRRVPPYFSSCSTLRPTPEHIGPFSTRKL
jgi:hypothetical protein